MRTRVLTSGDIAACPKLSLLPAHYRDDGTCWCGDRQALQDEVDRLEREVDEARARLHAARERLRTS